MSETDVIVAKIAKMCEKTAKFLEVVKSKLKIVILKVFPCELGDALILKNDQGLILVFPLFRI